MAQEISRSAGRATLWRRAGAAGFAFFLVKGMAWLAVPLLAWFAG
ncbi:MAG TPA: hypothetical protein VLW45_02415 [Pelomicrobium sp.]|nr:hypothetical protein [Pelomicrobium sp.]